MSAVWNRGVLRGAADAPGAGPLVVKLGGSLLGRPGWSRSLVVLLDSLPAPRVVVVGGGPLVDGLRAIDRAEPRAAGLVHRLAIECMGLTARLTAAALGVPLVMEAAADDPPTVVLDAPHWLAGAGRLDRLPVGWHVTSDSIAAVVAAELGTPLVLVKSVPPPSDDVGRCAAAGWVDGHFPEASRSLARIGWAAPASLPTGPAAGRGA